MLNKSSTRKEIEQSIGLMGGRKRYQLIQGIVMGLCWIVITFLIGMGIFVFMNPIFSCNGQVTEEKQACGMLSSCQITNKFTATSYSGIVCDKQTMRSAIQSMFYVGNLLALVTFAPLSDSKGRRPTSLVVTLLLIGSQVLMYVGIQHSVWALMLISQLLNGVFVAGMSINTYVFTAEYCTDSDRQKYIRIYWVICSLSCSLVFVFYNYIPDWYYFITYGLGLPAIVLLVLQYFLIQETPHFVLFLEKDLEKFNKCIDKLLGYNNCTEEQVLKVKALGKQFYDYHQENKGQKNKQGSIQFFQSARLLFDNRDYLWIALRLSISKIAVNALYFALTYCFERLGFNFGLTVLIFGIHEAFGSLIASFALQKAPKKETLIVSIFVCSLLGFSYFLPFINGNDTWETVMICLTTVSIMFSFVTLGLMSVEYFPAEISSTSIGIIDCVSYTISIFMPFFVNFMHNLHINPIAGISILVLVCGIGPLIGLKDVVQNPREDLSDRQALEPQK